MSLAKLKNLLEAFDGLRIAVIGDVILDHYIWGDVGRISPEAPVPLVDVSEENHRLGGAANVALNLGTLGVKTSLFGRIGGDAGGKQLQGMFKEASIAWQGNLAADVPDTIVKSRVVARNQQLCRLDREGRRSDYALDAASWESLLEDILTGAQAVLLSDYAKGVIDDNLLGVLKKKALKMHLPVFCDPKPRYARDFGGLTLLTPNRGEAIQMSEVEWDPKESFPAEKIVEGIYERYRPKYLVITLGSAGMLYAENGRIGGVVPTFAREVYDVSGAGDTVVAVLSAAILGGASLSEAVSVANVAAGIVVGKLGTATADLEEILTFAVDHWSGTE